MSLVFNMVGGGSGGGSGPSASDAILIVTTSAGSTVTATKGSVSLTPTLWTAAADATQECALFVIPAAQFDSSTPWTVAATDGTGTETDTVVIDSNKQYDLSLGYKIWLVKHGVLLATFTRNSYTSLNQLSEYTQMIISGNNYGRITTQGQIDVTDLTALKLKLCLDTSNKYGQSFNDSYYASIGVGASNPSSDTSPNYNKYTKMTTETGLIHVDSFTVDLSGQSGLKYVSMLISSWGGSRGYANIYDFYLER